MRFGVIGTNFITDRFINAGRLIPEFELVAVGSRTAERGKQFSEKHSIPYVFTDFEKMAESGLIDAVYVATPNYSHCEISRLFLAHGVHVLCEKPFAINEKEVVSMIEAARENNVKIMEASRSIYMPEIQAIKNNLHRIGQTRRAILQMSRYSSRYDLYLQGKPTNTFDVSLGNGAIMDMGVYNIQLAVFLFGYPNSITATGTILEDGKGIDGLCTTILQYDGFECVCMTSKVHTTHLYSEIAGQSRSILFTTSGELKDLKFYDNQGNAESIPSDGMGLEQNIYYELKKFIQYVEEDDAAFGKRLETQELSVIRILDETRRQIGLRFPNDL